MRVTNVILLGSTALTIAVLNYDETLKGSTSLWDRTDHELCHTLLNGLKGSTSLWDRLSRWCLRNTL